MKQAKQENRLSRWSRRKQQTAEETQLEDLTLEIEQQVALKNDLAKDELEHALSDEHQPNESPQPVLSDADMEPVEALTENSDFTKFMSPGVSDELRNLALKKMFQAPFFNIRDGLDEYDEDYTTFEKLGDIVTADMRHQMEMEANRKLKEEEAEKSESATGREKQGLEGDVEQTPPVTAEDEGPEELDNDLTVEVCAEEESPIPGRVAEKIECGQ